MRRPLVFSIVRDQSLFMTAIMSMLSFLAILRMGVAIAIGTGVARWNSQWDLYATVQIMSEENTSAVEKILDDNKGKFTKITAIPRKDMEKMLQPWLTGASESLGNYLPTMYEIEFAKKSDIKSIGTQLSKYSRFLPHSESLRASTGRGWRMIFISILVLVLVLGAVAASVSYIARNTALIHKRELEILNQIGAHDSFVARQMQIIVAKICTMAGAIGFIVSLPILWMIISAAKSARVGLMAMMDISTSGWIILILMPIAIIIFAIWITKKTTLKILCES
jgi:cell division protein FtsX